MKTALTSLLALMLIVGVAEQALAGNKRTANTTVKAVEAYTNGSARIFFNDDLVNGCHHWLRANGEGASDVLRVALAAHLSGKSVYIEYDDDNVNDACNLTLIRVLPQ